MIKRLALIALFGLAMPVVAQETVVFTSEDAALMTQCLADQPPSGPQTPEAPRFQLAAECIGAASGPCMQAPENQTTIGMSQCLERETDWWDSQLNADYAALGEILEPELADRLRDAQRAWIAFRDESCAFEYALQGEGTIRILVAANCRLTETAHRAITLASYLDPAP